MAQPPHFVFSEYPPSAVLRIRGEDALAFLQGQFTQELRHPPGQLCAYGLWLNQKGKVLADSFALRNGTEWLLVSIDSAAAVIRERLEAYIIADDVVIEDETAEWRGWALAGNGASEALAQSGIQIPAANQWAGSDRAVLFRGRRSNEESWEWLCRRDVSPPALVAGDASREATPEEIELLRVRAGLPSVPKDIGPGDLPNEGGLEEVAISYTKGCYLGQEVMARLKSMGQVRRRLVRVEVDDAGAAPGQALMQGEKKIGELRSCVAEPSGKTAFGLAMISLVSADTSKPIGLGSSAGPVVRIVEAAS